MFAPFQYVFASCRRIGMYPHLYSRIFETPRIGDLIRMLTKRMRWSLILPVMLVINVGFTGTAQASNQPATGAPFVIGSAYVGQTLAASTIDIADDNGLNNVTYQYQWLRRSSAISGATQSTYMVTAADLSSRLEVRVDFTDDAGYAESLTSTFTRAVTEPDPALPEVSLVTVSPTSVQADEVLRITVRINPPIPAGAPNITGGVMVWDTGNCDGVQRHAFVFRPGQTEAEAAHYWVPCGWHTTDRTIQVFVNPAFDDFFRIGQPLELTASVQDPGVTSRLATPGSPAASYLEANYPNPFNGSTWIPYHLDTGGPVRLEIYNILGQRVRTLVNTAQTAGAYQIRWDSRNQNGTAVATGTYIARLQHPSGTQIRRLLYLK